MSHHVVLGAGAVGRHTTARLAELGHTVTLASRSGRVTDRPWEAGHPGRVEVVAADASDSARLTELARGATSIVNAINPPSYTAWATDWPPIAAAVLVAAERSGAGLVMIGNLYGYGAVTAPMTEQTPPAATGTKGRLRNRMWAGALALHEAGRIRVTELRSSDYVGPGSTAMTSFLGDFVIDAVLAGRPVLLPMGTAHAPHSWTYLPDVAHLAARVAVAGEHDDAVWGRPWHVPSPAPRSVAQAAADVAALQQRRPPRVLALPRPVGTALGAVLPLFRELLETRHQFEAPFVLDSSAAQAYFDLSPTPWEQALQATVAHRAAARGTVSATAGESGSSAR